MRDGDFVERIGTYGALGGFGSSVWFQEVGLAAVGLVVLEPLGVDLQGDRVDVKPKRPYGVLTGSQESVALDHLVGSQKQRVGDRQAERLGGLEVDHEAESTWPLNGQVACLGTLENLIDVGHCALVHLWQVGPIGHQTPGLDE
jgi:hypothetical protein